MTCERNRPEIRDVALGASPSRRLEAHLASCPACRDVLAEERRRLAEIDDELGNALAVEPSSFLLPRVREVASRRLAEEPRSRLMRLLPVAASIVALAVLLPLAQRTAVAPGRTPVPPSPAAPATRPTLSQPEAPLATAHPQAQEDSPGQQARGGSIHRRAAARPARAATEPEVIVAPGGEAALRRYVQAIRHARVVGEVVRDVGPDPVDWTEPASLRQQPRTVERFPEEMEPKTAGTEGLTTSD